MTLQSPSAYNFLFNLFSDAFIRDLGVEILCSLENSLKKLLGSIHSIMHVEERVWGKTMNPCVSATTKFYLSRYENPVVQKNVAERKQCHMEDLHLICILQCQIILWFFHKRKM